MNKKYLIIGGIAITAVLIYLWYKNKNATVVLPTSTTANPVTGQTTTTVATNTGSSVPSVITAWMNTLPPNNRAQAFKMLPSFTDNEIAQLTALITNYFNKGNGNVDAATRLFWDTWRKKYHISDGTILN